jgi:acylphosphatase
MARAKQPQAERAVRARISGAVTGVGFRPSTLERAQELGLRGWVRNDDGDVLVHAEGDDEAVSALLEFLDDGPEAARVERVEYEDVKAEGHEQFAIRGVSAGSFDVLRRGDDGPFELRLEVDGELRAWAVPKGPSMDPATRRMAFGPGAPAEGDDGVVWDRGTYEQGGRVPWPEAIERGHAVFVLHGEKLAGGFALQRTRPGPKPGWLLIKRKDEAARPGSDVAAELPDPIR